MKKNVILIGCGEVGSAIEKIEKDAENNVYIITQSTPEPFKCFLGRDYDVMHINIGFSDEFNVEVIKYISAYKPMLVIVNSTVIPGTITKIKNMTNVPIVHSPIRGIHPNLYEGVKTFTKYIGGTERDTGLAEVHLKELGLTTHRCKNAETTEIGKILSTTAYGCSILFAKHAKKICDEVGADFEDSYTDFTETYNEGYFNLDKTNVIRPVLYPPEGKCGGHCVSQNFELLPESKLKKHCKDLNED